MSDYLIDLQKHTIQSKKGRFTEIWAHITDKKTKNTINKKIWWEDENGIYHDATSELPYKLRNDLDNIWIEKKRKW